MKMVIKEMLPLWQREGNGTDYWLKILKVLKPNEKRKDKGGNVMIGTRCYPAGFEDEGRAVSQRMQGTQL